VTARPLAPCPACGAAFDPAVADWCDTRRGPRTPVCPECGACLCGAAPEAIEAFWRAALRAPAIAETEAQTHAEADTHAPAHETYELACPRCAEPFDAASAAECGCATSVRTPVCPHCRRCLCDLPFETQVGFWAAAPDGMRRGLLAGLHATELARTDAAAAAAVAEPARGATKFRAKRDSDGAAGGVDLASFLNPGDAPPAESFPVECCHCRGRYEALDAAWCFCIGAERSTLCPLCLHCICAQSKEFRQQWWAAAHPELRARRITELRTRFNPPPPMAPADLPRPAAVVAYNDDERLRIAGRALQLLGWGVVYARDGLEAFTRVKSHRPEVLLADAILPRLNGREVCRKIKADPFCSRVGVILTTGLYTRPSQRDEAFRIYKVDGWLLEPVEIHALRDALAKVVAVPVPALFPYPAAAR